ncbi:C6 transcription factor, partial [Fusarium napiforme]
MSARGSGLGGNGSGSAGNSQTPLAPKRKNVDTACLACKKRKFQSRIYEMVNEDAAASNSNAGTVGHEAQYRAPYHAAKLIEPRIDTTRPSQWTLVPASENLLRELLKMYFLYEYPTFTFFHKDHFLDDMAAGRENFCSSYLVNAILAAACHAYTKAAHRTEFWNPRALQYQFLAEARRIRELEAREDSLTTIQGLLVSVITYNMNSMDEIGFSYIVQAISMGDR